MEIIGKPEAWNKDKLVGQKPPLKPKDIWAKRPFPAGQPVSRWCLRPFCPVRVIESSPPMAR